jgi:DNA-binding NarL/FixJ family response regulator
MPRATVLLADDHAIVAEGLASLLHGEFALVGTVADGAQLVETARRLRPDLIVTDLAMPGLNGLDALRQLKADGLAARVVVLTMHADAHVAAEVLRAGASGFVVKHAAGQELIAALHAVLRGRRYVTPDLADDVLATLSEPPAPGAGALTPRQRDVVRLLAAGATMKEVAAALGLSPRTVETHKYQSMEALGLKTTAELIRYALEHGLTTPPAPA